MAKTTSQGQARKTSLLSQSPPDMHNSSNYCKTQRHSRSKLTTEKSTRLNIMCKCPPKTIIILATLSALSALLLAAWSTHKDRKRLGRAGLRRVFANHWWGQGKLSPVLGFGQFGLPPPPRSSCMQQYDNNSSTMHPQEGSGKDMGNGISFSWLFKWLKAVPEASVAGWKYNLQLNFSIAPTRFIQRDTVILK